MHRLAKLLRLLRQAARLMVGIPDYETYVAHRRACHPGEPVMSYAEFFRERQDSRYASGKTRGGARPRRQMARRGCVPAGSARPTWRAEGSSARTDDSSPAGTSSSSPPEVCGS